MTEPIIKFLKLLGDGLHTYPDTENKDQRYIYNECARLEKEGLLYRKIDEPGHVYFMMTAKAKAQ